MKIKVTKTNINYFIPINPITHTRLIEVNDKVNCSF